MSKPAEGFIQTIQGLLLPMKDMTFYLRPTAQTLELYSNRQKIIGE